MGPAVVVGLLVLAGGLGLAMNGEDSVALSNSKIAEQVVPAPYVDYALVSSAAPRITIRAPGRLQPRNVLDIVGEVSGKVTYVNPALELGGQLKAGEVLLRINATLYDAALMQAKAAVQNAKAQQQLAESDYRRIQGLAERGNASVATRDRAEANLEGARAGSLQAKAQLISAQENLDRTVIRAPFPAAVLAENVTLGTYVSPGQSLARIFDVRAGEIVASLTQRESTLIAAAFDANGGKEIAVTAKSTSGSVGLQNLIGVVKQFSPAIDQKSRTATILAVFPDVFAGDNTGRVFAGDFMTLEIDMILDELVWKLPFEAVRKNAYVWTVGRDDQLRKVPVQVLERVGSRALVTSDTDLTGKRILLTLLSEENEDMSVRLAAKPLHMTRDQ